MNAPLRIPLQPTPEQAASLRQLQAAFAEVCNALAPTVRDRRCWNRVTLHHLAYRQMRDAFPHIGSQMVCNAIYAVCRTARIVFQHPASPFSITRFPAGKPLPLLTFTGEGPVIFDRHTLSLKDGVLSLYTLDGRIRFKLSLSAADEGRFLNDRLREVLLSHKAGNHFELVFWFADEPDEDEPVALPATACAGIPPYVKVEEQV
jgi:hypothetical protein